MHDFDLQHALALPPLSRRREPRIDVAGTITVRAAADAPDVLAIRDLSFRGFSIDTSRPVTPRATAQFSLQAAGVAPFTAVAVAVHCHRLQHEERWVSGWEFPEQPGLDVAIERLLDVAVGVLTIE
jgi:hypothetical protein